MSVRFQNCRGWTLLRAWRWQVELWWCPRGECIPAHTHQQFDGRLVFLGGRMRWLLGHRSRLVTWRDVLRSWSVPAGAVHGAEVVGGFGLFLNIERWHGTPTSAAVDFVRT